MAYIHENEQKFNQSRGYYKKKTKGYHQKYSDSRDEQYQEDSKFINSGYEYVAQIQSLLHS